MILPFQRSNTPCENPTIFGHYGLSGFLIVQFCPEQYKQKSSDVHVISFKKEQYVTSKMLSRSDILVHQNARVLL